MGTIAIMIFGTMLTAVSGFAVTFLKTKRDQYNLNIDDATIANGVRYAEEVVRTQLKNINASDAQEHNKSKQRREAMASKPKIARSHIQETGLRVKRSNVDVLMRAKVNEIFNGNKNE